MNKELKEILELIKDRRMKKFNQLREEQSEKYLLYLNASGEFTIHMAIYMPKEFKTFTIKIDSKALEDIQ